MGTGKKFVKRWRDITSTLNPNHTANDYILIVTNKLLTLLLSISANIESSNPQNIFYWRLNKHTQKKC